jgi:hypothetical protein
MSQQYFQGISNPELIFDDLTCCNGYDSKMLSQQCFKEIMFEDRARLL